MSIDEKKFKEIRRKLISVKRKEEFRDMLSGFLIAFPVCLLIVFLLNLFEMAANLDTTGRTVIFYFGNFLFGGLFFYYFVRPLLKLLRPVNDEEFKDIAHKAGYYFPDIKDELLNNLQLLESKNHHYSESLIHAGWAKMYAKIKSIDFSKVINFKEALARINFTGIAVVIIVISFFTLPGFNDAAMRILNYEKDYKEPPKYVMTVTPGNKEITKGENVEISVTFGNDKPEEIYLNTKSEGEIDFKKELIRPDSAGMFSGIINNITGSTKYYVQAEDVNSSEFDITVINRPVVKNLRLRVIPPAYTGLEAGEQFDNGNITALPGSRVEMSFISNKTLSKAFIDFENRDDLEITNGGNDYSASFGIRSEDSYSIKVKDDKGIDNKDPINYSIAVLTDESPFIEIVVPGEDVKLGKENFLQLAAEISDDYGFSKLTLNYRISESQLFGAKQDYSTIEVPVTKSSKEDEILYTWDLNPLYLAADDVVTYYMEVFDNDNVNGPKSAKSKLFSIRVPSLNELFADADDTHEKAAEDLTKTLEEAKDLKEELENISNEMKRDKREITWEEKEKIEKALDKFEELQKKISDVQKSLNDMQKDMQQNNLLSEETMKKYMELQDLMDELSGTDITKQMKQMQDMLSQMDRNKIQQNMEDLKQNEEFFKKSIERTINLLKRIQVEQKMDEIVKRTEDIMQRQEELEKQLENSGLNDEQKRNELQNEQEDISESLQQMQKEMEELQNKMNELSDMPKQDMQRMMEEMQKQNNEQLSKNIEMDMQEQRKQKAQESMQMLTQNLKNMQQQMQSMQQQMQQKSQVETFLAMMKVMDNILALSMDQETLHNETENTPASSPEFRKKAQEQSDLSQNLGKIFGQLNELSQKTFAITPEMGQALGNARRDMNQALNGMSERNIGMTKGSQLSAMSNLNEAANLIQSMMTQMMNQGSGSGGGMMSLMQQLQQMTGQQMQLNKMTKQLQQGQMSQEQMAQMQRLAGQQEMIRKSLEQLNKEAVESGQSKKFTRDFEQMMNEMQEVVTKMRTENLDDDLVQKQEKILSKMLDAQRSINERDFEDRREAKSGENQNRKSPEELIFSSDEGQDVIREALIKAVKEGYSKDYEELIRKYFEELQKNRSKN